MKSRVMYVELKTGFNDNGPAWIGRVAFSKTGQTIYYRGKSLRRIPGGGVSGNYRDLETGEEYWISGVKKNREDRHWAGAGPVEIDEDSGRSMSAWSGRHETALSAWSLSLLSPRSRIPCGGASS